MIMVHVHHIKTWVHFPVLKGRRRCQKYGPYSNKLWFDTASAQYISLFWSYSEANLYQSKNISSVEYEITIDWYEKMLYYYKCDINLNCPVEPNHSKLDYEPKYMPYWLVIFTQHLLCLSLWLEVYFGLCIWLLLLLVVVVLLPLHIMTMEMASMFRKTDFYCMIYLLHHIIIRECSHVTTAKMHTLALVVEILACGWLGDLLGLPVV